MVRLTIEIDEATYESLKRDAAANGRSVEEEVGQRVVELPVHASSPNRNPKSGQVNSSQPHPDPAVRRKALEEMFAIADRHARPPMPGATWRRADIYEERAEELERRRMATAPTNAPSSGSSSEADRR